MDAERCPYYQHLAKKKDELVDSEGWDADELQGEEEEKKDEDEIRREEAIKYAIRLYRPWEDDNDTTYKDVAKAIDEHGKSLVGDRVQEWRDGEHRDLVPEPGKAST